MTDETVVVPTAEAPKKAARKRAAKKAPAKKKAAKKAPAKKSAAGRTSKLAGKKITKLVKDNPRREGTNGYKSFSLIKTGMSVESFTAAGGRLVDLKYDIAHKYVKVA